MLLALLSRMFRLRGLSGPQYSGIWPGSPRRFTTPFAIGGKMERYMSDNLDWINIRSALADGSAVARYHADGSVWYEYPAANGRHNEQIAGQAYSRDLDERVRAGREAALAWRPAGASLALWGLEPGVHCATPASEGYPLVQGEPEVQPAYSDYSRYGGGYWPERLVPVVDGVAINGMSVVADADRHLVGFEQPIWLLKIEGSWALAFRPDSADPYARWISAPFGDRLRNGDARREVHVLRLTRELVAEWAKYTLG